MTIWDLKKAKINRVPGNAPLEVQIAHGSALHLPYEIIDIIIAHVAHDLNTLKACSLICRSWYIAAVPRIHHTVSFGGNRTFASVGAGFKILSGLQELNLMPLVREVRILEGGWLDSSFGPGVFYTPKYLAHFSAFTNVHTLKIQSLDISGFLPCLRRYFEQFSTTLRSISLEDPYFSSPRQLSCFLSFFRNLDDIDIRAYYQHDAHLPDTEPVPFYAPALRGRLTLHSFPLAETWAHLIDVGGLRFRHVNLRNSSSCIPLILEACAETLETLRFHMTNPSG